MSRASHEGTSQHRFPYALMALSGHLDLVCGLDVRGIPVLTKQSFRAPMHLSKGHLEGRTLVLNVINPTAGLLAGDYIRSSVTVDSDARLLLTTPSASRAHTMSAGSAVVEQQFQVAERGFLEVWPELFIPQASARYRQRTEIRVAAGGELMFWELLAPGRVASGEAFAYSELEWETYLYLSNTLIARERYRLAPGEAAVEALRSRFPTAYYASAFVLSPRLTDDAAVWRQIHDLHGPERWVGVSALNQAGWTVRVITGSSVEFRRVVEQIRRMLYEALGDPIPSLRRAGFSS